MKKLIIPTIIVLMALFASSAFALTIDNVKLGSNSDEHGKNVTNSFVITNNGNATVTNIQFSHTGSATLNLVFSGIPAQLLAGQSATVTLAGSIPRDLDTIDANFLEVTPLVATMTATGTEGGQQVTSNTANILMQAENQLEVKDVTLFINGDSQSVSDGDKINDIKPGDEIRLEIVVENKFKDNDDQDVEFDDIEVTVLIDDNDFDVDESEDISGLSAEDEDEVSFEFDVEDDVSDKTYTLEITAFGRDENDALHGEKIDVRLSVERETHDVTVRRAELLPASLACGETTTRATVTISNLGKRDEDAAAVEIVSPQLKINEKRSDIELDEDRSRTEAFDLAIPTGTKPGTYRLDVNTYFDNIARSRTESLFLTVEKCEVTEEPASVPKDEPKVVQPPVQVIPPAPVATPVPRSTETKNSFQDSTVYLALLGGISGLLFLIIVALVVFFVMRKRE